MTNEQLTELYNAANGLDPKRHNPITTERIFVAMRGAIAVEREANAARLAVRATKIREANTRRGKVLNCAQWVSDVLDEEADAIRERSNARTVGPDAGFIAAGPTRVTGCAPAADTETEMKADHIHTPNDGRGQRDVFVDGKLVERAFFADTRRGIVRAYKYPLRLDKWRKRVLAETLHGVVDVRAKVGAGEAAPEGHNASAKGPGGSLLGPP